MKFDSTWLVVLGNQVFVDVRVSLWRIPVSAPPTWLPDSLGRAVSGRDWVSHYLRKLRIVFLLDEIQTVPITQFTSKSLKKSLITNARGSNDMTSNSKSTGSLLWHLPASPLHCQNPSDDLTRWTWPTLSAGHIYSDGGGLGPEGPKKCLQSTPKYSMRI